MPDNPTPPDLSKIISILYNTETSKLFETIRPLDMPTGEKTQAISPEILAVLREAEAPGPFDPDPLPTDPDMLKARLEMASFEKQHGPIDEIMKRATAPFNVFDSVFAAQDLAQDNARALHETLKREYQDKERRKREDSENLARIAKALDRDPEARPGQEPPQDMEQATTGRGNKFDQAAWLETLNTWTGLFFGDLPRLPDPDNPRRETGNPFSPPPPPPRKLITREQFRKRITNHHPDAIPSLVSLAWSAIPGTHKEADHLPPEQNGAPWKGTGPARTVEAITRALFDLFRPGKPGPDTTTQKPTSKALEAWLGWKNGKAIRAIWQGIPNDWKHKGRPPATPDKKA